MDLWLYISTWNVMTMPKPGKMNEIAEQMLSTHIQIIALQEIRWKEHGQMKKNKYSLYYSCSQQIPVNLELDSWLKNKLKRICPSPQSMKEYAHSD